MPKVLPIGAMHFRSARQRDDLSYVDKSAYIGRVLRSSAFVLVQCRPRRFGKTLNLSMLREWLHRPAVPELGPDPFRDMVVLRDELACSNRERHAVLHLSLKGCKSSSWAANIDAIRSALHDAWSQLRIPDREVPTWFRPHLSGFQRAKTPAAQLSMGLKRMATALYEVTGTPVWLLIDEYDAPIQTAWQHGYYGTAVDFLRPFLGEALKDSNVVQRAVLTGILRVAKEGIFSEMNGVVVDTVLDEAFATDFGFTEQEVGDLAGDDARLLEELRSWYNGYNIGGNAIYNPWSVANALSAPHRPMDVHWMSSGGLEIIERIATRYAPSSTLTMERLLAGESVPMEVVQGVTMPEIDRVPDMLLNVLLHTGYVTATSVRATQSGQEAMVRLPNREIARCSLGVFDRLVRNNLQLLNSTEPLVRGLLDGDAPLVEAVLGSLVRNLLSYHDLADKTPERIYHVFVLGLLARLPPGYRVSSNKEFGEGRPDVVIEAGAEDQPSALLEFKTGRSAKTACEVAAAQIEAKRYVQGVRSRPVFAWAVGFSGKGVVVRRVAVGDGG